MTIIYLNCGKYELDRKKITAGTDTTFAVVKRKPEKKKIRLVRDSNQRDSNLCAASGLE